MADEEQKFTRRNPSVEVQIADVKNTKGRIAVIGTVVNKNNELFSFILDDGKAQVLVLTNNIDEFEQLEEGKLARVLGKTVGEGEETEILADVVQDFLGFDLELYRKSLQNCQ